MTPEAYLSLAIRHKCYRKIPWIVSALAVTLETEETKADRYPGKIIREPFGLFYLNDALEPVKFEGITDLTAPLFRHADPITITKALVPTIPSETLQTTFGRLLINLVCLVEAFGTKVAYVNNSMITPSTIEKMIQPRVRTVPEKDSDRTDEFIYIDELVKFSVGVSHLEFLSSIICHSVTEVGLVGPPGIDAFKKQLLEKYQGKLDDPVVMSQFEAELEKFDEEYLKNDPSNGIFMKGKPKNARLKMFLTMGGEVDGFTNSPKVTPNIPSLQEGMSLDREVFTAAVSGVRYSSFARGAETVNGGVVAKGLMRAADNWEIVEKDCGTPLGIRRVYREDNINELVGRYIALEKEVKFIANKAEAAAYIGKKLIVRSPQYCRQTGTKTCKICAGAALSQFKNGLPIPLMEVSGGILNDSLKLMHNTRLVTATVDLAAVIT